MMECRNTPSRPWTGNGMRIKMPDWLWPVLIIVGYVLLMRWILPAFGVPT